MKAGIIVVGVVILAAVFGGIYILNQPPSNPKIPETQENVKKTASKNTTPGSTETEPYQEYTQNAFEKSAGKKRVLFFYASWCPTCRPADADFKANINRIPEDIVILRVNYNDPETDEEEKTLAKKYGITYQHTYVQIDKSGNQIATWNGGALDELLLSIK